MENRFIPDTLGDPRPGKGLFDISTDWGPHCIVACAPIRSFFGGRSKQRTRTGNNGFWTVFEHFFRNFKPNVSKGNLLSVQLVKIIQTFICSRSFHYIMIFILLAGLYETF